MAISKHEEKKQLSEDNERRDLEKNNFVFPPAYSRGKRKIQFPIGMDKSDESWRVTTPSGKHKRINPGEVLPLKDNLSFEAGKTAVRVKKN